MSSSPISLFGARTPALRPQQPKLRFAGQVEAKPEKGGCRASSFAAMTPAISKGDVVSSPAGLKSYVDSYVMDQETAKRDMSLLIYEHLQRFHELRHKAGQSIVPVKPHNGNGPEPPPEMTMEGTTLVTPEIAADSLSLLPIDKSESAAFGELAEDLADALSSNTAEGRFQNPIYNYCVDMLVGAAEKGVIQCRPDDVLTYVDDVIKSINTKAEARKQAIIEEYKATETESEAGKSGAPQQAPAVEVDGDDKSIPLPKSNILILGPTGSGKTHTIRTLLKAFAENGIEIPFVKANAADITEAGYHGLKKEDVIRSLFEAANKRLDLTESGIVFLDEIDKKKLSKDIGRDVSGEGAQDSLLAALEDGKVDFKLQENGPSITADTSNILWIAGGAFPGILEIIAQRLGTTIDEIKGLKIDPNELYEFVQPEDLIEFGMKPELIGRFPVIIPLKPLSIETLGRILTEPKDALVKQYQRMVAKSGVKLEFTPDAIEEMARIAYKKGTGARALQGVIQNATKAIRYRAAMLEKGTVVTIDAEQVRKNNQAPTKEDLFKRGTRLSVTA